MCYWFRSPDLIFKPTALFITSKKNPPTKQISRPQFDPTSLQTVLTNQDEHLLPSKPRALRIRGRRGAGRNYPRPLPTKRSYLSDGTLFTPIRARARSILYTRAREVRRYLPIFASWAAASRFAFGGYVHWRRKRIFCVIAQNVFELLRRKFENLLKQSV